MFFRTGRLLVDTGNVDKDKLKEVTTRSEEMGRASFRYAWLLDKLKIERERGITIEGSSVTIETAKRTLLFHDTPGLKDFSKNMSPQLYKVI